MFTRVFLIDLAERAGKTFLQAFLGVLGPLFLASQTNVGVVHSFAFWQSAVISAAGAGAAAVFSLLTSVLSGFKTGSASASVAVASTAVVPDALVVPVTSSGYAQIAAVGGVLDTSTETLPATDPPSITETAAPIVLTPEV